MNGNTLAGNIDALLPQTQCTKCGYAGCMPYAEAIAASAADINQCAPGGAEGVRQLAALLRRADKPLNPANGGERRRAVALINEARCIGCTLCIQACPVDAIVGAAKRMHTVIAEWCTGCELCVPPCPVDCIDLLPVPEAQAPWTRGMADAARARFAFRRLRLEREQTEHARRSPRKSPPGRPVAAARKEMILAAFERAKARRAAVKHAPPQGEQAATVVKDTLSTQQEQPAIAVKDRLPQRKQTAVAAKDGLPQGKQDGIAVNDARRTVTKTR